VGVKLAAFFVENFSPRRHQETKVKKEETTDLTNHTDFIFWQKPDGLTTN
jgi:hypothetical protein